MSKQTNLDYIKTLTAEQFVELLRDDETIFEMSVCSICSHKNDCNDCCKTGVIEWLNAEREDG